MSEPKRSAHRWVNLAFAAGVLLAAAALFWAMGGRREPGLVAVVDFGGGITETLSLEEDHDFKQPEAHPEDVIIKVDAKEYPYIETKPLHETQRKISFSDNEYLIGIKVCINYELEQLLLSYGDGVQVISPESLRERIKCRMTNALKKYGNVHIE